MSEIGNTQKNLTPGEIYDLKRKNFKQETLQHFQFLVSDLNYDEPIYKFSEQENGTVTSDSFFYRNPKINRVIAIKNQYHPYDYGFSIEVGLLDKYSDTNVGKLLLYKLKEEQDILQSYIKDLADKFRTEYLSQIDGSAF